MWEGEWGPEWGWGIGRREGWVGIRWGWGNLLWGKDDVLYFRMRRLFRYVAERRRLYGEEVKEEMKSWPKRLVSSTRINLVRGVRRVEFWLTFAAYAIPLGFLLYVLYWNFLPFGYDKTFTIQVGSPGDTSGEFHLDSSPGLSEPMIAPDGTTYRTLNGMAKLVLTPGVSLRNARVSVSIDGSPGVSILPPSIDFNLNSVQWNYLWDFSTSSQKNLVGAAFHKDNCEFFDGKSKLELPNSADEFESGPLTIYTEWEPEDSVNDNQEIVGHFNWTIWQNSNNVVFTVGRMNSGSGGFYSITYPISNSLFFKVNHSLIATYNPGTDGYIDLYVDSYHAGRTYFGNQTIWPEYSNENLSLGWTSHDYSRNPFFKGCIYKLALAKTALNQGQGSIETNMVGASLEIYVASVATSTFRMVKIHVKQ